MPEAPYPDKLYAVLFTDLEGSSVLNGRLGDDVYKPTVLAPLLAIQREAIAQHQGIEEGTPAGDSIMALFPKTDDAIQAALAMLEATKEWNAANKERTGQEVWQRVGIHFSEEVLEWKPDTRLSGHSDCNFAARIMGLACGGQIVVSQRARERKDVGKYDWWEWPHRRIKSFEDKPENVYTVGWAHENAHKEPGTALIPDWLREQNRYIARPDLENRVVDCFKKQNDDTRPAFRLVTIHGFGGMGKTRLALRCCALMLDAFESNVRFVRLDNIPVNRNTTKKDRTKREKNRAKLLAGAIATTFGLPPEASTLDALPTSLPHHRVLLVLDNFETVACTEAGRLITRLIEKNADLNLLVIGRQTVGNINLEKAMEIVPLNDTQARELLEDRIRMRRNHDRWQPTPTDEGAIVEILRLTQGHPLSLVLVAARADKRSLSVIADGLKKTPLGETRLDPNAIFDADTERHNSLELSLEWSWKLLNPSERSALACLSLFATAFTEADALGCFPEDATGTTDEAIVTENGLKALQEAALIDREERAEGQNFYSLLRPTQQYAAKMLQMSSALDRCISGFISYYRTLMEKYAQKVYDHDPPTLAMLDTIHDDAVAAFVRSIERNEHESATAIYNTLTHYQFHRYFLIENQLLEEAMLAFRRAALPKKLPDIANSLHSLARVYESQMRSSEAERFYKEALTIRRTLPKEHLDIANSLHSLATMYRRAGRYSEAEPLYEEALAIRRKGLPKDDPTIAVSLNSWAVLYRGQRRYSEAESLCNEALAIRRKVLPEGHPDIASSLDNLADLYIRQKRYSEAEPVCNEALAIRRASLRDGHPGIAHSLDNLAELYIKQKRYPEAEPVCNEALAIRRASLYAGKSDIAYSLDNLAELYISQKSYPEAESLYKEALGIRRKVLPEVHLDIAQSLHNLAELYRTQGRYSEAEPLYKEAMSIFTAGLGVEHPDTKSVAANYADLLEKTRKRSEADEQR